MELILITSGILLLTVLIGLQRLAKKHLLNFGAVLAVLAILGYGQDLSARGADNKGKGLQPLSEEAIVEIEQSWPTIIGVRPNKVGLERLQHHRKSRGLAPLFMAASSQEEEFETVIGGTRNFLMASSSEENFEAQALPSSVDNSKLPSFPPIGDQKQLGSCVAWGSTYYQFTHEYGLLNGINNKNDNANVFSPKWTYNSLNGGYDQGLEIFSTYNLLTQNGVVSIASFPYDSNYLAWDLVAQDWISALSHRAKPAQLVSGIGGNTQDLQVIKQLLNNGHILTFGTYIESWKYGKVGADPAAPSNPHAGELAAVWQNGYNGGHCMTIVGYDDNVWIDVNGNGKVDPGEKGAFLIANSWSTSWGNKGFVWIAYDAFLAKSAVSGGPSSNRVPIADAMGSRVVSVLPLDHNYAPKLVAQFSVSQSVRNQISVVAGVSDTNATTPVRTFESYALKYQGGNREFDGTLPGAVQTATFSVDLTDLLPADPTIAQRYYLIVNDNQTGKPTTINSFKLIDLAHNNNTVSCKMMPASCDRSQAIAYIDYTFQDAPPEPTPSEPTPPTPPEPTPPAPPVPKPSETTAVITSPINNQIVSGLVWVTVNAKDPLGISNVEFYVDGIFCSIDKTAPYQILLDTNGLLKGKHTITTITRNTAGMQKVSTVDIYVRKTRLW